MYVLDSCVRVAPRRPLAMAAEIPRSGADCHVCPHATQTTMSETAEPAKDKSPKCRKRDREGGDESEVSEKPPRVKMGERSEDNEREKGKRNVKLTAKTENKRKTAADFRAESEPLAEDANLASEGPGRTFGAAVLPDPVAEAPSDSSSCSSYSSVPSEPRGRSHASSSSGEPYKPQHSWSDQGREPSHEAVPREKKERGRVKDRSRG